MINSYFLIVYLSAVCYFFLHVHIPIIFIILCLLLICLLCFLLLSTDYLSRWCTYCLRSIWNVSKVAAKVLFEFIFLPSYRKYRTGLLCIRRKIIPVSLHGGNIEQIISSFVEQIISSFRKYEMREHLTCRVLRQGSLSIGT